MTTGWHIEEERRPYRPGMEGPEGHARVSPRFLSLIQEEPLEGMRVIDVGCGAGRLSFLLAPRAKEVVGVDRDPEALAEARRRAEVEGLTNVRFREGDVESVPYRELAGGPVGMVVSHLCMSDAILARAAEALSPGAPIAFACFHAAQWAETGRSSRFAYREEQLESALRASGFEPEWLGVEKSVVEFASAEEALEGYFAASALAARWRGDSRGEGLVAYVARGGRTFTPRCRCVVKARRRA